jgi:uncharacterized protein (TIGR03067 family)
MVTSLLIVVLGVGAPAPKDKPTPADGLVGEWVVESLIEYGQTTRLPGEGRLTLAADGGFAFTVRGFEGNATSARYAADPAARPPAFDLIRGDLPPGWKLGNREWVGIYKLDGAELTICYRLWADPRPTEFRADPDSGQCLIVLRRAKPGGAKE